MMDQLTGPIRATIAAVREALSNDGIRRIELIWAIGIAADAALLVVLLVAVYAPTAPPPPACSARSGWASAVLAGMLAGAVVRRFGGRRVLVSLGVLRPSPRPLWR